MSYWDEVREKEACAAAQLRKEQTGERAIASAILELANVLRPIAELAQELRNSDEGDKEE